MLYRTRVRLVLLLSVYVLLWVCFIYNNKAEGTKLKAEEKKDKETTAIITLSMTIENGLDSGFDQLSSMVIVFTVPHRTVRGMPNSRRAVSWWCAGGIDHTRVM